MEPKIIFEDEELLVIDKPAGVTVNRADTTKGERTVQDYIISNFQFPISNDQSFRSGIVHRLDKETSGILLVAKTPQTFFDLQRQFKERQVKKTYVALVHGEVKPEEGEITVPIGRLPWNRKRFGVVAGGREAVTKYKSIRYFEVGSEKWDFDFLKSRSQDIKDSSSRKSHLTLLELYPETGRTHQIRVHLKYVGHPIFGDPLYGGRKQARDDRKILPRVFLHAAKILFTHPKTGEKVQFESILSKELQQLLDNA